MQNKWSLRHFNTLYRKTISIKSDKICMIGQKYLRAMYVDVDIPNTRSIDVTHLLELVWTIVFARPPVSKVILMTFIRV